MTTDDGDLVVLDPEPTAVNEIRVEHPSVPLTKPPELDETVLTRQVRFFTAICSFAGGVLHLLAMAAHIDAEPTLGRAFLAVAVLQIVWGVLLIVEPRRLFVLAGGLVTIGSIVVWVFSRTKGISWFPGMEHVEALEWRDVVTQFFQLLAVAGAALLLLPTSVHKPTGKRVELVPIAIMALLAIGTLGVLYVATYDYTHGGGAGGAEHSH